MIFDPNTKQISFADFDDDEEEVVDEQQHYLDLVNDAKSMMKKIQITPNENFPDFLWEPVQNTFTDDESHIMCSYLDMGLGKVHVENGVEIMQAVSRVRNRYKNYFDYIDALEIWMRYYDFVEDAYGSFDFFASLVDDGSTSFPLKRKPKLKNGKAYKQLLELNVPISRINREDGISDEEFAIICSQIPDQIEIYEDYYEYMDFLSDINRKEEDRLQRVNRVKGFRKTSSVNNSEVNAIIDYLSGEDSYKSLSNFGAMTVRPLSEDIEAFHEYDGLNEDLKRDAMGLRNSVRVDANYGVLMSTGQTQDDIDVYSALYAAGYDVGMMLSNTTMDKKAVKLITGSIGCEEEMSSKKAKKMKKKREKMNRKLYEQLSANEGVRDILTKNRVSLNAEDNMISFTSSDLWG